MAAVLQSVGQLQAMPDELHSLDTGHGNISFHVVHHMAHGVKVNIKTEIEGSGGGWSYAGTGASGMSISSESHTVRSFWLKPIRGGKQTHFEMIDSEFNVADGHEIIGMYAQVENHSPELFALVNVSAGTALRMNDTAASDLHAKCSAQLLGKPTMLVGMFSIALLGAAGYVLYKTSWLVGVPVALAMLLVGNQILTKVPMFQTRMVNEENRKSIEKKIKERLYLCLKHIDSTIAPHWV